VLNHEDKGFFSHAELSVYLDKDPLVIQGALLSALVPPPPKTSLGMPHSMNANELLGVRP